MALPPTLRPESRLRPRDLAWLLPVLPLAALAVAPACGGDETDGQSTGVTVDKFAEEYQKAACEHAVACNYMPDVDTCLATTNTSARVVHGVAAVTSGDITYDANKAQACVDAVRGATCTEGVLLPRSVAETCDAVFAGRKAEGESCYHSIECDGVDAVCEGECFDSCCAGTCRTTEGGAMLGEECSDAKPCIGTDDYCGADPMTGVYTCVPRAAAGKPCFGNGTCVIGYECDPASGTCFKQAPAGGTCNPAIAAAVCANIGEYCDSTTSLCTPFPGAGEPCAPGAACARYAFCDGVNCQLKPNVGVACPGNFCMGDLPCSADDGTGSCLTLPATVTCQ